MNYLIRILVSILPVVAFLIALIFLDSYKLVRFRSTLLTVLIGFVTAFICYLVTSRLTDTPELGIENYSLYIAPLVEEILKASYIIYLISSKRVGFMVDAAIHGFALGTGFAIIENIYYLKSLPDSNLLVWIVRGFGTAVMHGGVTALFGIVSKSLTERLGSGRIGFFMPGLLMAVIIHSLYNHFFVSPVFSAVILVVGLPLLMIAVFQQSETALKKWLGVGFDTDAELLKMITTGNISKTRIGEYLISLKSRFPGEVVADMLCLLRIHVELSIKAKGTLLMREAGFDVPADRGIKERFDELKYLEKNIGKTGRLAILPFLHCSSRDLWQLYMLGKK